MDNVLGGLGLLKDDELREWGISRRVGTLFLVAPLVGAIVVALTRLWYPLFRLLTAEDRLFEWAQFVCWIVGSFMGLALARTLWRMGHRGVAILWTGVALAALIIAGEEIAWGQRLLGLETPTALERVNRQGEITVHNIGNWGLAFDAAFIAAGLYGAGSALWFRYLRPSSWNRSLIDFLVPPLFLATLFLAIPLYKLIRVPLWVFGVPSFTDYGEYNELCLALGFAGFSVLGFRRPRRAVASPRRTDRQPDRIARHK